MVLNYGRSPKVFLDNEKNWREIETSNKEALIEFDREKAAQGASDGTRYMYLFCLQKLCKHFPKKTFKEVTKKDMIEFFEKWRYYKSSAIRISIKAFYKWVYGGTYPEAVSWIKTHGFEKKKLPEDILSEEEVKRLADSALNPRDRALILLLYESGARAGELMSIKLKDVKFDEYGAVILLDGKTGMRRVRLIDCVPDLKVWMNNHPRAKDPNVSLFVELRTKYKSFGDHCTLTNIIKAAKRRAGMTKRIYPHLFRHSRATHLAKDFTEQELKVIFGWSGSSRMPATYVHLSGADVDKKMLEKHGILENKNRNMTNELKLIVCKNCSCENSATARFCSQCGIAFYLKDAMEAEVNKKHAFKLIETVLKNEDLKQAAEKRLIEQTGA